MFLSQGLIDETMQRCETTRKMEGVGVGGGMLEYVGGTKRYTFSRFHVCAWFLLAIRSALTGTEISPIE
jgi:hypothetical protein